MHHAKTQGLRTLPVVLFSIASGVSFAATHDHSVDLDSLSLAEGLSASVAPAHEGREIELRPAASFGLAMGQLSGFLSMGSNSETNSVQELHARVWSSLAGTSAMAVLLQNGLNELEASHGVDTSFMKSKHFQRYHQGLEVIGETMILLEAGANASILLQDLPLELNTEPSLTAEEALRRARFFDDERPIAKAPVLKILPKGTNAHLVYEVVLGDSVDHHGADLLIDAHSGELLSEEPHAVHIAPVKILSAKNSGLRVHPRTGAPVELDLDRMQVVFNNASQVSRPASRAAVRARDNARTTLEYYKNRLGRNSFDDRNSELVSVVHIGRNFSNAFWHKTMNFMAYGDGAGDSDDFTAALDVAGHEMTHGVINSTVRFRSTGQPGSLNEAFSDFFGEMIELHKNGRNDWLIGRELFNSPAQRQAGRRFIRNVRDPQSHVIRRMRTEDGSVRVIRSPSRYRERLKEPPRCTRANNFCWVHLNSTVWSHATYQIYRKLGRRKTERLLYLTMVHALRPSSGFLEAGRATRLVCDRVYSGSDCAKVGDALSELGL